MYIYDRDYLNLKYLCIVVSPIAHISVWCLLVYIVGTAHYAGQLLHLAGLDYVREEKYHYIRKYPGNLKTNITNKKL